MIISQKKADFFQNIIYYGNTDSLYTEKKNWDELDKAKLVGEELCQGEKFYPTGGCFYRSFLAPKLGFCLTIDNYGIIQKHRLLTDSMIVKTVRSFSIIKHERK